MIKRSGALLLSLLYLITATGFALNLHLCGDEITSVSINASLKTAASCSAMPMKCCANKHLVLKVKDSHLGQKQSAPSKIFRFKVLSFSYSSLIFSSKQGSPVMFFDKHPPDPPLGKDNTFLKNRSFRI